MSEEITITYSDETDSVTVQISNENGADGIDGIDGTDGVGVPAGGTTGQVLAKISGTNYETQWVTPSGGSGGVSIGLAAGLAIALG